jgi:hypothetical protein
MLASIRLTLLAAFAAFVCLAQPAMIGNGDRVTYGRAGVRGRLAVGLWPHPVAFDYDGDGKMDLIVGCPDRPYNGTYFFRNIGTNREPLFAPAVRLGQGLKDLVAADFNGDGKLDLVVNGGYYSDVRRNGLREYVSVRVARDFHIGRDDLWYPVDWDDDGKIDLLEGVSDWREYGWDDAFNSKGEWTRGPIHGYVYFHRNLGNNDHPVYAPPVALMAGGKRLDLRGSPSPNPVDWFGRGRLDLIGGDFIDTITIFENLGTRAAPNLDRGRLVEAGGQPVRMELCMIQPRVVDWYGDGRPHLIVGQEDGTVLWIENVARKGEPPVFKTPRHFEQVDPFLKSGALSRPVPVDWNGDGRLDLLAGNSGGYVQYFENVGTKTQAAWEDRGYLKAAGETIHVTAGPNGSVQGPVEEKWGYSNPVAADWDLDGRLDLVVNDIWGKVVWYRNAGSRTNPVLEKAQPVEVEWTGAPPKPRWVWWTPRPKELVTQWRTTPRVVDWNRDGLPDLAMLDHEGYLAFYERYREGAALKLKPPTRIFLDQAGAPLRLAARPAGGSGRRKIDAADWDGDGDLDLIVDSASNAAWYENVGSQQKPVFVYHPGLVDRPLNGHNPTPATGDFNGDGRLDIIIGAEDGFFYFFDRRYIDRVASRATLPGEGRPPKP